MTDQTRTKLIAVILVGAVVWAGLNFSASNTTSTKDTPLTIAPIEASSQMNNNMQFIDIEEYEKLSWGISPFFSTRLKTTPETPNSPKTENSLTWILSGILFSNNSPTAIINKRPVKIGETIDKAVVTNIEKEKVMIKYKQQEITLTVSKG